MKLTGWRAWRAVWLAGFVFLALASTAHADVERIEILERGLVADGKAFGNVGAYERLRGRLHFVIDANAAANQAITDIKFATRDAQGRIRFAADFMLLKPTDPSRGNNRLLYEPPNRGNPLMLVLLNDGAFGNQATTQQQVGNGFLMEQGYSLLWTGWGWDVPLGGDRLRADLPIATEGGKAIEGLISGEILPTQPTNSATYNSSGALTYEPARTDDPGARLTVRDSAFGPRTLIGRDRWQFGRKVDGKFFTDPAFVTLTDGFKPGLIYTLTYTARGPRVNGLGLAGIRDALYFFRGDKTDQQGTPNPLLENGGNLPSTVVAFGHSQSARLLNTMIADGLVADDRGRLAFDAALISGVGAGKGSFNIRFGQSARRFGPDMDLDFPSDWFPFTTATQVKLPTDQTGSILDRVNALGAVPRTIYVNGSNEYWARPGSLLHTSVDGRADIAADKRARIFLVAGGSHAPGSIGDRSAMAQCRNPLDHRPLLRALLMHADGWASLKHDPPASAVPTLATGTLGKLADYLAAMPKVTGLRMPVRSVEPPRLEFGPLFASNGIMSNTPPLVGRTYTTLLPMPDSDGLDKAGIRLPDITVPLGTYTGWNLLNAASGAPDRLSATEGSFIPFARNENERIADGDPRPSIAERYPTRDAYIEAYAAAALALANKEMILGSDINRMVERAGKFYDVLMARAPDDESCSYLDVQ